MAKSNDKITIHNVAHAAGVSISTVSRVLNNMDRVAAGTRKKVEAAIKKLNFYPNSRAKAFSSKRTDMIGMVVPDFQGQYFTTLMEGAYEQAKEYDVNIMVVKAKGPEAKIKTLNRLRSEGRTDGIILMLEELSESVLESVEQGGQPLVILDKDVSYRRMDNILVDNKIGAFEAAGHLINVHGATDMFFVGGPEDNIDTIERAGGFSDAVKNSGRSIVSHLFFAGQYDYEHGYKIAKERILPLFSGIKFGGIVAANDDIACGIIDAMDDHGVPVPQKVGVIGFDDSQIAIRRKLKLTTLRVPMKEIGRAAVRMVMNRLSGYQNEPTKLIFKSKLIVRNSCGCDDWIDF